MDIKDRLLDSLLSGMTLTAMGVRDVDGDGDLDQVWRVHNPYWANIKLQWGIVGSSETGFLKVHKESDSYFWTDADKGTATLSYRFANQTYWQITSATANSNPLNWNPFQNGDDSGSGSGGNPSNLPDLFTDERDTVFFDSTVKQENYRPGTSTYAALDGDDYVVLPTNDNWAYQAGIAFDAGDGDDFVKGGAKGDLLLGSLGNDSLLGEAGNDTLAGGDGFDVIRGGEGTDTAVFVGTLSDYSIQRIASTVYVKHGVTEEMDRVEEAELLQFGDRVYRIKDLPSYLPAGSNVSGINYSAPGGTGGDGPAQGALFTDYNEFVHLGDVAESDYKPGTPTHAAGGGNDYVSFPNANNWAYTAGKAFDAGAGDDIINGGANGDWILGNTGNDVLSGGGGNDTLDGGDGVDVLRGGEGTDTAVFVGTLSDYSIQRMGSSVWVKHGVTEEMDRVEEAELLQFGDRVYRIKDLPSYLPAGSNVSGINYSAPGGTGGDGPAQGALFTDYNEIVHLGVVAESDYKPGTPTHAAGGGNDYVTLPDTDNWAYTAGKAFDAGAGDDVVIGGASGDWIVGGSGNDVLSSGGGGDTLDGGGGYDTAVFKKPFSDYVFSRDGNRIVLDDGIQKSYLIDVEAVWLGDDFTYTSDLPFTDGGDGGGDGGGGGGTDPTALYTEGADILNLGNLRQEDHPGVVPAQNALGGNDQITLPSANNWAYTAGKVFDAGAGSDSITGGANGDWIVGNTGNDTLVGNGGNDTLAGGAGSDSLNGGDGIDTAVFDGAITDYIVRRTGGQITVAKYDGTETDRLSGIETLKFGDKTYQVSDLRTPRGDFNGDGRADVLWRDGRTNALSIWDLNGSKIAAARDVSVQETGVALPGASWAVEATVDFTGDGRADVLWRNGTSGQLALWEMNGHTVVSGANTGMVKLNGTDAAPGLAWKVESTADFTGDGKADILWRNSTSNQMLLWAMNGGTVTATAAVQLNGTAVAPAQAWKVEGAADFTGDGKADILWRNGTS
ncbi:FG-GAP-like repeat-containing protein, partial [Azospirillum soli]|uniref:FG-GAP-like repeat-containing protein n=1 Tax=Azospirillum soli TaxID=1304799 RepID=UPI001AE316AC